jgi:hypothetical protein
MQIHRADLEERRWLLFPRAFQRALRELGVEDLAVESDDRQIQPDRPQFDPEFITFTGGSQDPDRRGTSMITRRQRIFLAVEDIAGNLVWYDRKDDEDLPRGEIEAAIEAGEITIKEIVETFGRVLRLKLREQV